MKKTMTFIVTLVAMTLGLVIGATQWPKLMQSQTLSPFPDLCDGLRAQTQQMAYPLDTKEIVVDLRNDGVDLVSFYPQDVLLEQRLDDGWHTVQSTLEPDYGVIQALQVGEPTLPFTVNLSNYKRPLTAGEYRLIFYRNQYALGWPATFYLGTEPTELDSTIQWEEGALYALVYVGYRSMTDWETDSQKYAEKLELTRYLDQYEMGGDECFLVIPRYRESEVALYARELGGDGGDIVSEKPLYTQRGGKPFLVFCNPSDIFSNVEVQISSVSENASFSPQISLRDGLLSPVERGQDETDYGAETRLTVG